MTKNIAILSLTILFSTATFAADFVVAKNTKCKVLSEGLDAKTVVNWHGACKNGMADGLGVARYLKGAKVESVFYGTMKAGAWDQGVQDLPDQGYKAGHFENNKLVEVKDETGMEARNASIKAFETASKAALQLSKEFEKAGNKASAKHYKDESEKLAQQMD